MKIPVYSRAPSVLDCNPFKTNSSLETVCDIEARYDYLLRMRIE